MGHANKVTRSTASREMISIVATKGLWNGISRLGVFEMSGMYFVIHFS